MIWSTLFFMGLAVIVVTGFFAVLEHGRSWPYVLARLVFISGVLMIGVVLMHWLFVSLLGVRESKASVLVVIGLIGYLRLVVWGVRSIQARRASGGPVA